MTEEERKSFIVDFVQEGMENIEKVEPELLNLEGNTGELDNVIADAFRTFHSLKGVAGFLNFGHLEKLTHKLEDTLSAVKDNQVAVNRDFVHALIEAIDILKSGLAIVSDTYTDESMAELVEQKVKSFDIFLTSQSKSAKAPVVQSEQLFNCFTSKEFLAQFRLEAMETILELRLIIAEDEFRFEYFFELFKKLEYNYKALNLFHSCTLCEAVHRLFEVCEELGEMETSCDKQLLDEVLVWLELYGVNVNLSPIMHDQHHDISEKLNNKMVYFEELKQKRINQFKTDAADNKGNSKKNKKSVQDIRIGFKKIEELVGIVEELGVISSVVAVDPSSEKFDLFGYYQATSKLKQLTETLQNHIMTMKMVPVMALFSRMERLVYDVSAKLKKTVAFSFKGEETEIDKILLDSLQDPLVHILRNAIDHGLETSEERMEKGKPDAGKLELEAWYNGGEICISIEDDGKGIDPNFVANKAVQKGIISQEQAEELSDADKRNLIFAPGFSTQDQVSEFSGRGVGMDVVKRNIEKLKGTIELDSVVGKGSRFLITLPLSNNLVKGMEVMVNGLHYNIRIASIEESFIASDGTIIQSPHNNVTVRLRDKVYPILDMRVIDGNLKNIDRYYDKGMFILVKSKGNSFVLYVDKILGTTSGVIKSLPNSVGKIFGVSGCSVTGIRSTDVSWTIDINGLYEEFIV